jgi:hypothetical protein
MLLGNHLRNPIVRGFFVIQSVPVLMICLLALTAPSAARADESTAPAAQTPPSTPPTTQPPAATTPHPEPQDFVVEGEISNLGVNQLKLNGTRVAVLAGPALIGEAYYLSAAAELDMRFGKFLFGLWAPVNVLVFNPAEAQQGLFPDKGVNGLRLQDYDSPAKFLRIFRYVTYGRKEEDLYINFTSDGGSTIGHGATLRRYVTNINLDDARLSGEIDAKFRYGGFEALVGNIATPLNLMGFLGYLKPFGGSPELALNRLSFGFEFTGDAYAPLQLSKGRTGYPILAPSSNLDPAILDTISVASTAAVSFLGASIETKVFRSATADIKPYIDYSKMLVTTTTPLEGQARGGCTPAAGSSNGTTLACGGGFTAGMLGRFGVGGFLHSVFRTVFEVRAFESDYIPGYFDSFYEVQKYQYVTNSNTQPWNAPTKLAAVMSRPAGHWVPGVYGELSYSLLDVLAITAAAQYSNVPGGTDLVLHLEVPTFEWLRFFASLYRVNLGAGSPPLVPGTFVNTLFASNTLIFAGARVQIIPKILSIDLTYVRAWLLDQTGTTNSFADSNELEVQLEVGWEFSRGTAL